MTKKQLAEQERKEAVRYLRKLCRPGTIVFTSLLHVSRSGMYRRISLHLIRNNQPLEITSRVATVLGLKVKDEGGVGVSGCGMDMGFHLVYELSHALYP